MQILKTGSTGAEVALLQLSLRRAQYGAPAPDGVFGGATKSALQTFQRSHGLTPDGIFGAETERALAPWLRGYAVHTVRPGDTLFSLAERYDASLGAIETANPALDPFALRPGQRITVPLPFSVVPTVSTAMAFMPSSIFSARGMVMVTVYLLLPPLFFPFGSMAVTVPVKARPGSASTVISASCPV